VPLIQVLGLAAAIDQIGFNWTAFARARGDTRILAVQSGLVFIAVLGVGAPLVGFPAHAGREAGVKTGGRGMLRELDPRAGRGTPSPAEVAPTSRFIAGDPRPALAPAVSSRDRALDGLRGVAALVVLTSHIFVASVPAFADAAVRPGSEHASALEWVLTYTPLHVVWGGNQAVTVFFVLSGYVLSLPVARGGSFRPGSYYPSRALRLYVPVWGALCLAAVAHMLLGSSNSHGTWWLAAHTMGLTSHDAWQSGLLLGGAGTFALLAVLWSLHWEVIFSLLLPLFLLLGRVAQRFSVAAAAVAFAVLFLSNGHGWALYMPYFALGTIMAFQYDRIIALRTTRARTFELGLVGASVLGLTAPWWLLIGHHDPRIASRLGPMLVAVGACGMVTLALIGPRTRRVLTTRPLAWSGSRSFSLYLVHEPIVVLSAFALGAAPQLPLLIIVAIAPVLLVTEGFYRGVERPSHRLARASGRLGRMRHPAHDP
jgi:peptidoglycan/LPS O-acetylase OafA/YrhL